MQKILSLTAVMAVLALASCGDTDLERGLTGAGIGAVGAELTGGSAVTGAVVGGAAGVVCDDVNLC